jgi:hypothetical protein
MRFIVVLAAIDEEDDIEKTLEGCQIFHCHLRCWKRCICMGTSHCGLLQKRSCVAKVELDTCPLKMWFLLVLTMKMMKQQVGRGVILILVTLGVEKGLVAPVEAIGAFKRSKCVFSRGEMDLSSENVVSFFALLPCSLFPSFLPDHKHPHPHDPNQPHDHIHIHIHIHMTPHNHMTTSTSA